MAFVAFTAFVPFWPYFYVQRKNLHEFTKKTCQIKKLPLLMNKLLVFDQNIFLNWKLREIKMQNLQKFVSLNQPRWFDVKLHSLIFLHAYVDSGRLKWLDSLPLRFYVKSIIEQNCHFGRFCWLWNHKIGSFLCFQIIKLISRKIQQAEKSQFDNFWRHWQFTKFSYLEG